MGKRKFIGLYVDAELHQKIEKARNFEPRSSFLGRLIAAALQEEDQCKDCGVAWTDARE